MQNDEAREKAGVIPLGEGAPQKYARAKKRCVGSLDGNAVYFVGSIVGFYLVIESAPGLLRKLSEEEHLQFKVQSRAADHG